MDEMCCCVMTRIHGEDGVQTKKSGGILRRGM